MRWMRGQMWFCFSVVSFSDEATSWFGTIMEYLPRRFYLGCKVRKISVFSKHNLYNIVISVIHVSSLFLVILIPKH